MSLSARLRKLEEARGSVAVSEAETSAARDLRWRHFRAIIAPQIGLPVWNPPDTAEIEAMRAAEASGDIARANEVIQRHWEQKNPGQSYAAYQERRKAEGRQLIRQMERDHAEALAREESRQRKNEEWEAKRAREMDHVAANQKRPAPSIPVTLH